MPGLLKSTPTGDDERRAHDRHRPGVVLAVLGLLAVYVYLFTQASAAFGLPLPAELAYDLGLELPHMLDGDGNLESNVQVSLRGRLDNNDDERLVLFGVIAAAFLCAYFLPLRLKEPSLVAWTTLALGVLYGLPATAGLVGAHLVVWAVFHPGKKSVLARLLRRPRVGEALRTAVVHGPLLVIFAGIAAEGARGDGWRLPLGVLLFCWQWARLAMYHVDYRDGQVPADLPVDRYLAVFLSPGVIANWNWGVTIPQGYAYLRNNFLSRDKNAIVWSGVRLLGVALFYLVCWDWFRNVVSGALESAGIPVFRCNTKFLVRHFVRGGEVGTASVLLTTLLDLGRFLLFFGSVMHFKVGVWRLFGYDVASYYNRPWLATNLVSLWGRYAFHYREFLVRVFYYPSFFRFFRRRPQLRVFTASIMAAAVGNFIWHISERSFFREISLDELLYVVGTWPYFVLLGLGIAGYQVFRMRFRARRRPWSRDRWLVLDVVSVYLTLQFFGLIHIFMRPASSGTVGDLWRLFLIGFGIHL